jgi:hypothetical protein
VKAQRMPTDPVLTRFSSSLFSNLPIIAAISGKKFDGATNVLSLLRDSVPVINKLDETLTKKVTWNADYSKPPKSIFTSDNREQGIQRGTRAIESMLNQVDTAASTLTTGSAAQGALNSIPVANQMANTFPQHIENVKSMFATPGANEPSLQRNFMTGESSNTTANKSLAGHVGNLVRNVNDFTNHASVGNASYLIRNTLPEARDVVHGLKTYLDKPGIKAIVDSAPQQNFSATPSATSAADSMGTLFGNIDRAVDVAKDVSSTNWLRKGWGLMRGAPMLASVNKNFIAPINNIKTQFNTLFPSTPAIQSQVRERERELDREVEMSEFGDEREIEAASVRPQPIRSPSPAPSTSVSQPVTLTWGQSVGQPSSFSALSQPLLGPSSSAPRVSFPTRIGRGINSVFDSISLGDTPTYRAPSVNSVFGDFSIGGRSRGIEREMDVLEGTVGGIEGRLLHESVRTPPPESPIPGTPATVRSISPSPAEQAGEEKEDKKKAISGSLGSFIGALGLWGASEMKGTSSSDQAQRNLVYNMMWMMR